MFRISVDSLTYLNFYCVF